MTTAISPAAETVHVSSWEELVGLPAEMSLLDEQFREICDHARRWACNPSGFQPSPVCLLAPLGEFVAWLADAVTSAEQQVHEEWADLSASVTSTLHGMQELDLRVAAALPVVS